MRGFSNPSPPTGTSSSNVLILVISLVVSLSGQVTLGGGSSEVALDSLCANKQVDLTRASQIGSLVEQLPSSSGASVCSARVREALVELNHLLSSDNHNVCSPDKVSQTRAYYMKYIEQAASEPLPESLAHFFLGYGLRVSNTCKKNMIASLVFASNQLLADEDFKLIKPWINKRSLIGRIMNQARDYDDLILPDDIVGELKRKKVDPYRLAKFFLRTPTGGVIKKLSASCERRFKPIYGQLILPLVSLSNIGFNYQGEELERELKEMKTNKHIRQWYRIVYLCEPILRVEVARQQKTAESTAEKAGRPSLGQLMKARKEIDSEEEDEFADVGPKIKYEMEADIRLGDLIVDPDDAKLHKLIDNFDSHKKEMDRVRSRVLWKLASFIKNYIKSAMLRIVG